MKNHKTDAILFLQAHLSKWSVCNCGLTFTQKCLNYLFNHICRLATGLSDKDKPIEKSEVVVTPPNAKQFYTPSFHTLTHAQVTKW